VRLAATQLNLLLQDLVTLEDARGVDELLEQVPLDAPTTAQVPDQLVQVTMLHVQVMCA
jgi:hypothetical protein